MHVRVKQTKKLYSVDLFLKCFVCGECYKYSGVIELDSYARCEVL